MVGMKFSRTLQPLLYLPNSTRPAISGLKRPPLNETYAGAAVDMKLCRFCNETKSLEHFSPRFCYADKRLNNKCKTCVNDYAKAWRSENSAKVNEDARTYYLENRDRILAQAAQWQKDNPQRAQSKNKRWKDKNPEALVAISARRRAKCVSAGGTFSKADVLAIKAAQRGGCAACKSHLSKGFHVDHVVALANGGTNDKSNLQLLCPPCNLSKGSKDPIDFMRSRGFLL